MTLTEERDLLLRKLAILSNAKVLENFYQAGIEQEREITVLTKERDSLLAAANLAMYALQIGLAYVEDGANKLSTREYKAAIDALRQEGVQ